MRKLCTNLLEKERKGIKEMFEGVNASQKEQIGKKDEKEDEKDEEWRKKDGGKSEAWKKNWKKKRKDLFETKKKMEWRNLAKGSFEVAGTDASRM